MRLDQVAQGSMPSGFEDPPGSPQRAPADRPVAAHIVILAVLNMGTAKQF